MVRTARRRPCCSRKKQDRTAIRETPCHSVAGRIASTTPENGPVPSGTERPDLSQDWQSHRCRIEPGGENRARLNSLDSNGKPPAPSRLLLQSFVDSCSWVCKTTS